MADNNAKIIKARNQKDGEWGLTMQIYVVYEGETEEKYLRDFYDDEIWVNPEKLIGKTEDEAREYIRALDIAYLRS